MKYIDIFGGIGGFSYGIEKATKGKWERVWYNDYDKYAVQTYNKNYGTNYKPTDITTVKTEDIPNFDVLCGGFPCQSFSAAGNRKGFEDTRGTMFFEIARILKAKRPKFLFLENVKGLLNHERGKTFTTILQTLEELGYETQWMVLNSKFFGVPQNRERVFIIGHLSRECRPKILPFPTTERESIQDNEQHKRTSVYFNDSYPSSNLRRGRVMTEAGTLTSIKEGGIICVDDGASKRYQSTMKELSPSLKATRSNYKVTTPFEVRRLTPIDCERLQGFPDNWTEGVSERQRYKQCGNAVTTKVIESIVRRWINVQ